MVEAPVWTKSDPRYVTSQATLQRALMYRREGSADPYVILDDDDAAADKDSIDTPRVFGRLLLCSSLGWFLRNLPSS